ncbi:MAG: MFS transporter [Nitrososphaerota archaeon]|nr:MFS transporter [Nitrososphaerota archaeon]
MPTSQHGVEKSRGGPRGASVGGGVWFLAVMFVGYFAFTADRTVLSSVLKPLSAAVGANGSGYFGVAGTAWLASAQFIGVLCFVLASGYLADRYGHRKVIFAGVVVFTAFTWLIGYAADFQEAFVFRLVSGFGEGLFWPAAMSAVANYFGTSKGLTLGIFYAGFDLGGAAGNAIGAASYSLTSDWRAAFFVAPLVGIPVIAGIAGSKRQFAEASTGTWSTSLGGGALSVLKGERAAAILAFAFFATWASIWQVAYLPYYYSESLGAGVPLAGLIAAAVLASGLLGKVLLGRLSDRVRRDRLLLVLSFAVVAAYGVFFSTTDFFLGLGCALMIGFFSSAVFPVMQALASDSSQGRTGMALGLTTTFQSVAAVIGTLLPGSLFYLGVGRAIALGAMIPAIIMVLTALFLPEPRKTPSGIGTNDL